MTRACGGSNRDYCWAETRISCRPEDRGPVDVARAFIQGAISGGPIVQLFVGLEPYFGDGNTEGIPTRPAGRGPTTGRA